MSASSGKKPGCRTRSIPSTVASTLVAAVLWREAELVAEARLAATLDGTGYHVARDEVTDRLLCACPDPNVRAGIEEQRWYGYRPRQ